MRKGVARALAWWDQNWAIAMCFVLLAVLFWAVSRAKDLGFERDRATKLVGSLTVLSKEIVASNEWLRAELEACRE